MRFLSTIVLVLAAIGLLGAQSLKVMTYNIRLDTPADGVNQWPNRIEKVAGIIQKYNPDIIGVQEALHHQLQDLIRVLPDYSYVGVGREDGKEKGEYSAILYRNDRFGVLQQNTRWLSETPDVPGSKSWDTAITRVLTSAKFFDKDLKRDFVFLNTHFDHVGIQARYHSAAFVAGHVAGTRIEAIPVLVTGDFNFERTESAYEGLLLDKNLIDTKPVNDNTGTYCGFEVGKMECKAIDYIFHTKEWVLKNYQVITDHDGTYYPSDHLPVMAEFELSAEK